VEGDRFSVQCFRQCWKRRLQEVLDTRGRNKLDFLTDMLRPLAQVVGSPLGQKDPAIFTGLEKDS
jgi:hypothetical protein